MVVRMSSAFVALTILVLATGLVQAKEWDTPLQKQVAFFDRNGDGIIYPQETYQGIRAMGGSEAVATALSTFINAGLSAATRPGKPPSSELPIEIENIVRGRNPSHTGSYDEEGRFVESKFEEIFSKFAHTKPDALTSAEVDEMLKAIKRDKVGGFSAYCLFKLLFQLANQDGFLQKETLKKVYDGTIFYELEKQHNEKLASQKKNS